MDYIKTVDGVRIAMTDAEIAQLQAQDLVLAKEYGLRNLQQQIGDWEAKLTKRREREAAETPNASSGQVGDTGAPLTAEEYIGYVWGKIDALRTQYQTLLNS